MPNHSRSSSKPLPSQELPTEQPTLPSGVESMAAVPKDLRPTNTKERKAFTEFLWSKILIKLSVNMGDILREPCSTDEQANYTEIQRADLEECLQVLRDKATKFDQYPGNLESRLVMHALQPQRSVHQLHRCKGIFQTTEGLKY